MGQIKMLGVDSTTESQCMYQIMVETIILVLRAEMATFGQCNILVILFL